MMKRNLFNFAALLAVLLAMGIGLAGCDHTGTTGTTGTTGFGESAVVTITMKNSSHVTLDSWTITTEVPGEPTPKYYPSGKFNADWGYFSPKLGPGGQRTLSPVTIGNRKLELSVHEVGGLGSKGYGYHGKQELPSNLTIVYNKDRIWMEESEWEKLP